MKSKSFNEPVQGRVKTDKKFAEALLREGIDAMLSGDVDTGTTIGAGGAEKKTLSDGDGSSSLLPQ